MKKLMFGFTMAAAMVACADIESSNIVGYQEIPVPAGFCMRTPTFRAMSGNYRISDFVVKGDCDGMGGEYAQIIDAEGNWSETVYYYLTEDGACVPNGWYKDPAGETPVSDEDTLAEGDAVFFTSGSDIQFVFAGQVANTLPTYTVPAGFCQVGNPTPVSVKIGSLVVDGEIDGMGGEYAQLIDSEGNWSDTVYYYLTEDGACVENGWYKDPAGETPVTDEDVLEPSEAVFFTSGAEFNLVFPKPL